MQLTGSIYLLLAVVSSAAIAIVLRLFQKESGNRYTILLGNYLTCVVLGFFMIPTKAMIGKPQTATAICGVIGGILFVGGLVTMQRSIEKNGAILTSAFAKLGLLVPLIMSIVFFGEHPKALQMVGLGVVLIAMWVISGKKEPGQRFSPIWLGIVLLASGFADGMAKVFDHVGDASQNELYIWYVFCTATVLTLVLLLMEKKKVGTFGEWKELAAGIAVGIPNYFCSMFLLRSLATIPAFITYPVFSTGTIIVVTLVSALAFRERPTKYQLVGLGMILVALLLLNM
ncbi:EamA-like transporter family protein [Lachnospiraceae bacterium XBB1006]|nr:EamA-like transporter family protein [Lachnospiraceae bacterium XBB1006]